MRNKEKPEFKGLLFFADAKKIQYLIGLGYDSTVTVADTAYQNILIEYSGENTLAHIVKEVTTSYHLNKPQCFKIFYESNKVNKHDIDTLVEYINLKLQHYKGSATDKQILRLFPSKIIHFLVEKGHYFENQVLIEKIVKLEKSIMNDFLSTASTESIDKKKSFKL